LCQNEELRRNDDLRELRQVVENVKNQLENQIQVQTNQKTQTVPKGNFSQNFRFLKLLYEL